MKTLGYNAASKLKKIKIFKAKKTSIFLLGWIQCNNFSKCEGMNLAKRREVFLHKPVTYTLLEQENAFHENMSV